MTNISEISYRDRTWATIDLVALRHNVSLIRSLIREHTDIMAVIKADAYGHGAKEIAKALLASGVKRLAVSTLDEGIELRKAGISCPILLLSITQAERAHEIIRYRLATAVYHWELALALNEAGAKLNSLAHCHIKIDSGMGRIGFSMDASSLKTIKAMQALPHLCIEGIFTHFACADDSIQSDFTDKQFKDFNRFCLELEKIGLDFPIKHCCNSAATIAKPCYHLDLVRPGLILYGFNPFKEGTEEYYHFKNLGFKPILSLSTRIIQVKKLKAHTPLGYSRRGSAGPKAWVATAPIGYADGLPREINKGIKMKTAKALWKQTGLICMDSCMLVLDEENKTILGMPATIGDELKIISEENDLSLETIAKESNRSIYELLCNLGSRVKRIYRN